MKEAVLEAGSLASLLRARHAALALALDAGFPELKASVWQSEGAVQGAVQALTPQMTENRKKVGCRSMDNLGCTQGLLSARNSLGRTVQGGCFWRQRHCSTIVGWCSNKKLPASHPSQQVEELLREALVLQACLERGSVAATAGESVVPVGQLLERLLPKRLKQYQKGIATPAASAAATPSK